MHNKSTGREGEDGVGEGKILCECNFIQNSSLHVYKVSSQSDQSAPSFIALVLGPLVCHSSGARPSSLL